MFNFGQLNNKAGNTLTYTYRDKKVVFTLGDMLYKMTKSVLVGPDMFGMLDAYIEEEGDVLKQDIYDQLVNLDKVIKSGEVSCKDFDALLSLIPFDSMKEFLVREGLKAPIKMIKTFVEDGMSSITNVNKFQTYTAEEYVDLIVQGVIYKLLIGPMGTMMIINSPLGFDKKEYLVFKSLIPCKTFNTAPLKRYMALINFLVEYPPEAAILHLARKLGDEKDEVLNYLTGFALIKKIIIAPLFYDWENEKDLASLAYKLVNEKVAPKGVGKHVPRKPFISDTGDEQAVFERVTVATDLPPNRILDHQHFLNQDAEVQFKQLSIDMKYLKTFDSYMESYDKIADDVNKRFSTGTKQICMIMLEDIIRPEALLSVDRYTTYRCHLLSYFKLLTIDEEGLAHITFSYKNEVSLPNEDYKDHIAATNMERLGELYPGDAGKDHVEFIENLLGAGSFISCKKVKDLGDNPQVFNIKKGTKGMIASTIIKLGGLTHE